MIRFEEDQNYLLVKEVLRLLDGVKARYSDFESAEWALSTYLDSFTESTWTVFASLLIVT